MKNKVIIIEYFTSLNPNLSNINNATKNEGIKLIENLCNILSKDCLDTEIYIIKNYKIKLSVERKIKFLITKTKKDWIEVIKKFDLDTKVLLIAPETENIYMKMGKVIQGLGYNMLNPNLTTIDLCSSKIKLIEKLEELKIPHVKRYNESNKIKKELILKPDNSAGSENIFIIKKRKKLKKIKNEIKFKYILQKLHSGKKGSFSMICLNGRNILLTCNKQLTQRNKKNIKQIGLDNGRYEKYRTNFKYLANLISDNFKGLFGYVGVDVIKIKGEWRILEINARLTSSIIDIDKTYDNKVTDVIRNIYLSGSLELKKKVILKKSEKIIF